MLNTVRAFAVAAVAASAGFAYADDPAVQTGASVQVAATPGANHSDCLRETGTHLATSSDKCLNKEGKSYDRERIESTGATNAGAALQTMDPSISIRR